MDKLIECRFNQRVAMNLQRVPIKRSILREGLYLTVANSGFGSQHQDRNSSFGLFSNSKSSFSQGWGISGMQMYTINSLNSGNSGGVRQALQRFSTLRLDSSVIQGRV